MKESIFHDIRKTTWLKQARAIHYWGNNTLTITLKNREITLSTIKKIKLNPLQQPKHLDDGYD